MPPRLVPKHQVYVDIPPLSTPNQRSKGPNPRLVPVVEIPHSPLWRSNTKPKSPLHVSNLSSSSKSTMFVDVPPRPTPLVEKNTVVNNATPEDPQHPKKRKASTQPTHPQTVEKKQRVDAVKAVAQFPRGRPFKSALPTNPASHSQPIIDFHRGRPPKNALPLTGSVPPARPTSGQVVASRPRGRPLKTATHQKQLQEVASAPTIRRPRKIAIPLPPQWTLLDGFHTKDQVEDRIVIREFFHRFAALMSFPKVHRDLLDDFSSLSDQTVKQMLLGLVDLLLGDAEGDLNAHLHRAKTELRKSALNPTKQWSILCELKGASSELGIADPAGVPSSTNRRSEMHIPSAQDLIPVVISLINAALPGSSVRQDILEGCEEAKKVRSKTDDIIKGEKARWLEEKRSLTEERDHVLSALTDAEKFDLKCWKEKYREAEATHKRAIRHEQLRLMEQLSPNHLRFTPSGLDMDHRTYYILSTPPSSVKLPTDEDRAEMQRWSWFMAVWVGTDDQDPPDSDAKPGWYGLHEPADIRSLIKWLEWRKLENESKATPEQNAITDLMSMDEVEPPVPAGRFRKSYSKSDGVDTKTLCKNLSDFADFLEWRIGGRKAAVLHV